MNVTSNQKKLSSDPTVTHNKLTNDAVDLYKPEQLMPKETAEKPKREFPEPPKFRMLPKIHKINKPGRPIVVLQDAIVLIFQSLLTATYNQQ